MSSRFSRRLVYACLLLLAWFGFVVDGAHALFSSSAMLSTNSITTGSAELLVSNSQNASSTIYEPSRPGFALNINPGQSLERFFLLKNTSQADIPLNIDAMVIIQNSAGDMAEQVSMEIVPVDDNGQAIANGIASSLSNLTNRHSAIISDIPKGEARRFKLKFTLNSGFAAQSQSLSYDLIFTGTQKL